MKIDTDTRIDDLLTSYPFLIDYLMSLSPKFKALKNPIMRITVGKMATVGKAAGIGGIEADRMISAIAAEIRRQTGEEVSIPADSAAAAAHDDPAERQAALKKIVRALHAGGDVEQLKHQFRELIRGVSAPEVARMEQALMDEGLPAEEIKRLCDVHVDIFKEALEEQERPEPPPGHPVHTFMKENRASEDIMSRTSMALGRLGRPVSPQAFQEQRETLDALLEELAKIDVHYTRKENQLFPMLEAHHFTGPSQVMWSIHDDIRAALKKSRKAFDRNDPEQTAAFLKEAIQSIRDMIYKEEHILYPASLDMLSEQEWIRVRQGEADIGYAWVEPDEGWPGEIAREDQPPAARPAETTAAAAGALELSTGGLTLEQLDLMLTHLPVDLTFVDENDRVAYYSEGPERIFPRSPAIIGREVRNCHPPKSVHIVNKILDAFKAGDRDRAEFWIQLGSRFVHIRYFAVRDKSGRYRGTLEVSQDLTALRRLEGESRLLDWD